MQCRALKRRRKSWLLEASALASSSLGVSEPALAQCSGPPDNGSMPRSPATPIQVPSLATPIKVIQRAASTSAGAPHRN
jgi:hypothetical protein